MKFQKHTLITIAGFIWFFVGIMLLLKGLQLLFIEAHLTGHKGGPLITGLMYAFTGAIMPTILVIFLLGLLVGFAKGKWALGKAAKRTVKRIYQMKGPIRLSKLYRLHDYVLVMGMIALGRLMHWRHFPSDVHGFIDIAIGSALIQGAMIYFRYAIKIKEEADLHDPLQK